MKRLSEILREEGFQKLGADYSQSLTARLQRETARFGADVKERFLEDLSKSGYLEGKLRKSADFFYNFDFKRKLWGEDEPISLTYHFHLVILDVGKISAFLRPKGEAYPTVVWEIMSTADPEHNSQVLQRLLVEDLYKQFRKGNPHIKVQSPR